MIGYCIPLMRDNRQTFNEKISNEDLTQSLINHQIMYVNAIVNTSICLLN